VLFSSVFEIVLGVIPKIIYADQDSTIIVSVIDRHVAQWLELSPHSLKTRI